jgi:Fe(3+) dicitrate transport protein
MRSKVYSTLLFCFLSAAAVAQYRILGTVRTQEDTSAIKGCVVYLNNEKTSTITDGQGKFLFEDLPNGKYELHFTSPEYRYAKTHVEVSNSDEHVRVSLLSRDEILEEVTIRDTQTEFGFTRMRAVENMGIYEAKKSEVIIPEQLTANLATNNARQVYSRVAGLNIWENDGAGLLSVGGRALIPIVRPTSMSVRVYDISADALRYPKLLYAANGRVGQPDCQGRFLQYGTQFEVS